MDVVTYTQCPACGRLLAPTQAHGTETCLRNQATGVVETETEAEVATSEQEPDRLGVWLEQWRLGDNAWRMKTVVPNVTTVRQEEIVRRRTPISSPPPKRVSRRRDEIVDFGNIPYDVVITRRCDCGHTLEQHHPDSKVCLEDCHCMAYDVEA